MNLVLSASFWFLFVRGGGFVLVGLGCVWVCGRVGEFDLLSLRMFWRDGFV